MMKLPAFMHKQFPTGETVTVFQDDAQFWRFYLIPGFPTVRTDPNNHPVFQLIKYNFSDESREQDPKLPRGGGYMVFDTELKVKPDQQDEVMKDLKKYVEQEYERLKALPNDALRTLHLGAAFNDSIGGQWSQPGMTGAPRDSPDTHSDVTLTMPGPNTPPPPVKVPDVVIGEPLWKSGKVTMNAPQAAGLVSAKIGERPASLIGNNVAAFSVDLTPDGATFMQQTLAGRDGHGATDLTPIQVVYELTMLAKLPPATMYVKVNTSSLYHSVHELFHEHDNCSDDYFTSETTMNTAIEAGLITIKIDAGGVTDADIVQMLTQQATALVQQILTKKFADKEKAPPEDWGVNDVSKDSDEVYRLKRETDVDMMDFEETMELRTTTEYKIAPQGTLQAFFSKVQDMSPYIRVVDTNTDPFFMTLGLKARAFAKWAEDSVAFVELELKYEQGGQVKVQSFTFTPKETEPQTWDPALVDGKRDFKFRWRVGFDGHAPGDWSAWESTTTRDLNVAVETPGKLDVEVDGVGLDFDNILDAILVHLRYEDPARNVPMAGQSVLIAKDRPSGKWTRQLFAPWDKPLEYKLEYLLKSGTTVEKDWQKTDGPTQNILVPRPNIDVLNLTLIPAGHWTDAIQAVLSLRYADGDYQKDAQFNFVKPDEFKQWAVLLLNSTHRKFDYKILATFKNGDVQETPWQTREGDQGVPVIVDGPPRLELKVLAPGHDFALTPLVKVDLEYADPQGTSDTESISLQSKDDVGKWSVPLRKDGPRSYRYKVTYFPASSAPVERDWQVSSDETLTVPRYAIPKIGADFSPTLQDFTLTPAVEVNLAYDDPQDNLHERMTLVFTKNEHQPWFVPVPDTAAKAYDMTVTWYYADGHDRASAPVKLEKTAVVIPRAPRD
jgi:hypothetical protein